ncbi:MAG: flagellar basal body protein, partial [Caldimicrobium sp.]
MGIFGTLFVGYTGLYSDSLATKVCADNITNLNTVGFKGSRFEFANLVVRVQEVFASEQGYGTGPNTIRTLFTQGGIQTTDVPT